jgi:uncharacterized Ntn-hydrolase superfamily protein
MTRVLPLTAALLLCAHSTAFATWSIIAVDRQSGVVVIASATCVAQASLERFPAKDLRDVQAIVFAELQKATPPDRILAMVKQDPDIERRQFAIVDLQGRMAGFSGTRNLPTSLDRQGQAPDTDIFYSVQGNILASEAVVTDAIAALTSARGDLTDRVMAAMEAADARGGDNRCSCDKGPKVNAPCTAKTAHVAYLLRADKGDRIGESHSDGQYGLYLSVTDANITAGEDANPVKTLRLRYDAWKKTR